MRDLAVLSIFLALVSIVRQRIAHWPLTTPMIFVGSGMALGADGLAVLSFDVNDQSVVLAAEITLAMLLFSDAARIDTAILRRSFSLPVRLLGIGLPLTIGLSTAITGLLLADLSWSEAALVAAILAPTDAALGQAVVADKRVPVRVRQTLNVESGLNDGLTVPAVTIFAALAAGDRLQSPLDLIGDALVEVSLGIVLGVGVGLVLGTIVPWVQTHGWTDDEGFRLVALGSSLAVFGTANALGGNGFLAVFACGLALRYALGKAAIRHVELVEDLGQVGASATFMIFGAIMVWPALSAATLPVVICAVATLTLGRMVPVRLAMVGSKLQAPTVAFFGWFGPRGLASMIFGLLIVAERNQGNDELFAIIALVILTSVVLHGLTAAPGAAAYARWFNDQGNPAMAEAHAVPESPVRWRPRHSAPTNAAP